MNTKHNIFSVTWSLIISHPMTNSGWVTAQILCTAGTRISWCVGIPWPTGSEWHNLIPVPRSLINHISFHDHQKVGYTDLFLCQAVSSIMSDDSYPMTNSMWVTRLLYLFARQSHQSCLIPWPTVCEWHQFIWLPNSLINPVSSHDQ